MASSDSRVDGKEIEKTKRQRVKLWPWQSSFERRVRRSPQWVERGTFKRAQREGRERMGRGGLAHIQRGEAHMSVMEMGKMAR